MPLVWKIPCIFLLSKIFTWWICSCCFFTLFTSPKVFRNICLPLGQLFCPSRSCLLSGWSHTFSPACLKMCYAFFILANKHSHKSLSKAYALTHWFLRPLHSCICMQPILLCFSCLSWLYSIFIMLTCCKRACISSVLWLTTRATILCYEVLGMSFVYLLFLISISLLTSCWGLFHNES